MKTGFDQTENFASPCEDSCQEIGLVTLMFFFELLFSYVPRHFLLCFLY